MLQMVKEHAAALRAAGLYMAICRRNLRFCCQETVSQTAGIECGIVVLAMTHDVLGTPGVNRVSARIQARTHVPIGSRGLAPKACVSLCSSRSGAIRRAYHSVAEQEGGLTRSRPLSAVLA